METRQYENVDEKIVEIILNVDASKFEQSFNNEIFNVIFNYYSSKNKIIYNGYKSLANFITDSNKEILKPLFGKADLVDSARHIQINQVLLIEALALTDRLSLADKNLWGGYLFDLASDDLFQSMHSAIFHALIALKDRKTVLLLIGVLEPKADHVLNGLLFALAEIASNDPTCVDLINRSIVKKRRLDGLASLINAVDTEEGVISIFETITNSKSLLDEGNFRYSAGFYTLFDGVRNIKSKKLDKTIETFVLKSFALEHRFYTIPDILEHSIRYAIERRPSFLKKLMKSPLFLDEVAEVASKISRHLSVETFIELEEFVASSERGWRINELIQKVATQLEQSKDHEIYKYIEQKYLIPWRSSTNGHGKKELIKTPIQILRGYYVEDLKLYNTGLIPHFVNHYDKLRQFLSEEDVEYLQGVVDMILNTYDPEQFNIKIKEVKDDQVTYTHNHSTWFVIEFYFKAAYLLGAYDTLIKYKDKLLKTLPRLDIHQQGQLKLVEGIMDCIGPLNVKDIDLIYNFCSRRKDDILLLSAYSFAQVIRKLKIHQLNPVLLKIIKNKKTRSFDKEEAIRTFGQLSSNDFDRKALVSIFNLEKRPSKVKDLANGYLISNFKDGKAILWRFDELKKRGQEFDADVRYNGIRGVSAYESELDRPEFPLCLYNVECPLIYEQMLQLLIFSFKIRNNILMFRYATYLQSIIHEYFKSFLSQKVIYDLRTISNRFSIPEQTYSFNLVLDKLVEELHLRQKKVGPFIAAVHSANNILSRTYLPIQSNYELKALVLRVFNNEIKSLIEDEGFYRVAKQLGGEPFKKSTHVDEELIQKTLKIALNKALLENGLRKTDIHREVESLDGVKYDYLISYGLYGPIVVELKLMHNKEITNAINRSTYKTKLTKYLKANSGLGIYAVFQVREKASGRDKYNVMCREYKDIQGLDIIPFNCF